MLVKIVDQAQNNIRIRRTWLALSEFEQMIKKGC